MFGALWSLNVIADFDVELSKVCPILSAGEGSIENIALSDIQRLFKIENTLLPMCIFLHGRSSEHDRIFEIGERSIEPCDESMNFICVLHL
jgi:hypothetical protein